MVLFLRSHFFCAGAAVAIIAVLIVVTPIQAQWVEFTDTTATNLDLGPISVSDPLEKDVMTADLNRDGWLDVIVARKVRFSNPGARTDILLINDNGVLVNRTADLAPGFLAIPTDARDVFPLDIDGDQWIDVVVANTFGQQPRLYRNLGNDKGGTWLGLADESFRLPTIVINGPLQFCAVWADDVTGNGAPDIYFSNYGGSAATRTFDVLLINDGTGNFTDETDRLRGPLGDYSAVAFGTGVEIRDVDNDGDLDIIKISTLNSVAPWGNTGVFILFNNGNGFFNEDPFQSIAPQNDPYMCTAGDLDGDGWLDFFFQNDSADKYRFVTGSVQDGPVTFGATRAINSPRLNGLGGNTKMADVDGDGDLDVGIASVDNDIQNCSGPSAGEFTLVRNDGGQLVDVYGTETLPWHQSNFDFAIADFDNDNLADIFQGNCNGYKLFTQTTTSDCGALQRFRAKCTAAGAIKVLIRFVDTSMDGQQVTFSIDGNPIVRTIVNGTVRYTAPVTSGSHTVSLDDPAGCVAPIDVTCP